MSIVSMDVHMSLNIFEKHIKQLSIEVTLLKTNISRPLKIKGWKMKFPYEMVLFWG